MSKYYNPKRKAEWNYGGKFWKLSRSKIQLFLECPRCFYIDNKLGTKRPPGYPFNLNTAVDTLLKKEFDIHRAKGEKHPLQEQYGIDARPVAHEDLDIWRDNFAGVSFLHPQTGMTISGAIDDLWINSKGEYIVVDYKSTSKADEIVALDQDWHEGYKRQMEVYQWLLRQNGYKVNNTGYFVYCNGDTDKKAFDAKLEFDVTLISYEGDDSWVENTIKDIYKCLNAKNLPKPDRDCDYCAYRAAAGVLEK
jgi:CRISPR/Cas system-associated exonuclease Cas4 (RecB family)